MRERRRERLACLRGLMGEAELDGVVVSAPSNVFYLSGFRGSAGTLLISPERAVLLSGFRYRLQAREQARDFEFVDVARRLVGGAGRLALEAGLKRLGYDPAHLSCELREQLAEGAEGVELAASPGLVEGMRAVKSPEEVELIRTAAGLGDRVLAHMMTLLRPGARERDIALEGEFLMRREGAEAAAFDLIVASGPRSALPHAETGERELGAGDLVVMDIGARVNGYCSDMTRTFAVGKASSQGEEIYRVVYRAQRAGAEAVKAGVSGGEVDAIARAVIGDAGYGEAFGHGLGHGVGIEVHEAPRLGQNEEGELVCGNVVTVEPGIYLEHVGGVRLEDLLVVGGEGAETLTGSALPAELPVV